MRKIKVLGLMLVAVFAMSAVAASAASADEFTAESYPVTLTGSQPEGKTDNFITTSGTTSCKSVKYAGSASSATTSVSLTPTYTECTALGFGATIDMKSCFYKFTIDGGSLTTGVIHIECTTAGDEITVTAISAGTNKCSIHVPPQTIPVTYTGIGSGTTRQIKATVSYGGLTYKHTKGTGLGACTAGSGTTGSYTGEGELTGASSGTHVGLFLTTV